MTYEYKRKGENMRKAMLVLAVVILIPSLCFGWDIQIGDNKPYNVKDKCAIVGVGTKTNIKVCGEYGFLYEETFTTIAPNKDVSRLSGIAYYGSGTWTTIEQSSATKWYITVNDMVYFTKEESISMKIGEREFTLHRCGEVRERIWKKIESK